MVEKLLTTGELDVTSHVVNEEQAWEEEETNKKQNYEDKDGMPLEELNEAIKQRKMAKPQARI